MMISTARTKKQRIRCEVGPPRGNVDPGTMRHRSSCACASAGLPEHAHSMVLRTSLEIRERDTFPLIAGGRTGSAVAGIHSPAASATSAISLSLSPKSWLERRILKNSLMMSAHSSTSTPFLTVTSVWKGWAGASGSRGPFPWQSHLGRT